MSEILGLFQLVDKLYNTAPLNLKIVSLAFPKYIDVLFLDDFSFKINRACSAT